MHQAVVHDIGDAVDHELNVEAAAAAAAAWVEVQRHNEPAEVLQVVH
jgi:hypothetical protein